MCKTADGKELAKLKTPTYDNNSNVVLTDAKFENGALCFKAKIMCSHHVKDCSFQGWKLKLSAAVGVKTYSSYVNCTTP